MSIKIIDPAYARAKAVGYKGSISDFVNLINTDETAYRASLDAAFSAGVINDEAEYQNGIKKLNGDLGPVPKKKTVVQKKSALPSTSDAMDSSSASNTQNDNVSEWESSFDKIKPKTKKVGGVQFKQKTIQEAPRFIQKERQINISDLGLSQEQERAIREKKSVDTRPLLSSGAVMSQNDYDKAVSRYYEETGDDQPIRDAMSKPYNDLFLLDKNDNPISIPENSFAKESDPESKNFVFKNIPFVSNLNIDADDFVGFLKNKTDVINNIENDNYPDQATKELNIDNALRSYYDYKKNFLVNKAKLEINRSEVDKKDRTEEIDNIKKELNDLGKDYISTRKLMFPELAKAEQQKEQDKQRRYDDIKNGKNWISRSFEFLDRNAEKIFTVPFSSMFDQATMITDGLGWKTPGERWRLSKEADNFNKDIADADIYDDGKQATINGTTYLVTKSGKVIDKDAEMVLNSFTNPNKLDEIKNYVEKYGKDGSNFNSKAAIYSISDVIGQFILQRNIANVGGKFNVNPVTMGVISSAAMSAGSAYQDTVSELKKQGVSDVDAKLNGYKVSLVTGVTTGLLYNIFPNNLGNKEFKDKLGGIVKSLSEEVAENGSKMNAKDVSKYIVNKVIDFSGEGSKEVLQEIPEMVSQKLANLDVNKSLGNDYLDGTVTKKDMMETAIVSFFGGLSGNIGTDYSPKTEFDKLSYLSDNYDSFIKNGSNLDNFDQVKQDVDVFRRWKNKIPTRVTEDKVFPLAKLLNERENLKIEKDKLADPFKPEVDEKIKEVDSKIQELIKPQEDAIQEQATDESVLGAEQSKVELQGVGEGNAQPEVITEEKETITPEGKEEVTDYKEISKKILDDKELNTVRASLRRSSPDSFSLQVLDSIAKKEPADTGDFELDQKIDDAIENGVSINTIANLILQDEDLVDNKGIDSKRKAIDYVLNIGEKGTLIKAAQKAIAPEGEKVTVNIAPFYDTQVASVQEAEELRKSEAYQQYKQQLSDIAKQLGIEGVSINENVGGYTLDDGTDIVEISNSVELDGVDMDQAQEYATLVAALSPEVQESSIVSRPTTEGADNHKANLYTFKVSDLDEAAKSAKEAGIANFTIDDKNGTIKFIDVFEFKDPDLIKKFDIFAESLDKKQINYEQEQFQPVESKYLGTEQRRETFRRIKKDGTKTRGSQQSINNLLEKAIQRDAEFQGEEVSQYIGEQPIQAESTGVDSLIENAKAAIANVAPEVKIVLHNTDSDYRKATGEEGRKQSSRGTYIDGTIHVNAEKANARTVAHETFHALLLSKGKTDAEAKAITDRMLDAVKKTADADLLERLEKFSSMYDNALQSEESIAELFGILAEGYPKLDKPTKSIIKQWLDQLAKLLGLKPFTDNEVIELLNTVSGKVASGEEINIQDIKILEEGMPVFISEPTKITDNINRKHLRDVKFSDKPYELSFVTKEDKVDILKLIDDIKKNNSKVWFWMADQFGRGNFVDPVSGKTVYVDAGPSFAIDPKNKEEMKLWASGAEALSLQKMVNNSDYIFFISGSPEKAKLFNKKTIDIVANRVGAKSSFDEFKKDINSFKGKENKNFIAIKNILNSVDSFEALKESSKRKEFLIAIKDIGDTKTMPEGSVKELLNKYDLFIDWNSLRDGFYKENNFGQNDIMLIGKPEDVSTERSHDTYKNTILGKVIGVPDKIINAWDIMPKDVKEKLSHFTKEKDTPKMTKVIAAESGKIWEGQTLDYIGQNIEQQNKEIENIVKKRIANRQQKDEGEIAVENEELTILNKMANKSKILPELKSLPEEIKIDLIKKAKEFEYKPKKTVKAYKLFTVIEDNKGELFPLFVGAKIPTPIGHWIRADIGGSSPRNNKKVDSGIGPLAFRPGWHAGDMPVATHIGAKKEGEKKVSIRPSYQVWAEVEFPNDFDWQAEANSRARIKKNGDIDVKTAHITDAIPNEGFYRYKTNSNMTGSWLISGEMRVNRILTDEEVNEINKKDGVYDLKRNEPFNYEKYGFNKDGSSVNSMPGDMSFVADVYLDQLINKKQNELTESINNILSDKKPTVRQQKEELSEENLSEDERQRLQNRIDGIIETSKRRGLNPDQQMENVIKNIQTRSPEYIKANDIEKEQIIRDIRKMFGKREKSAKTFKNVFGLDEIIKVTMPEKKLRDKQIKDLDRGAKMAKAAWLKANAEVVKKLRELEKSKKITSNQAVAVLSKFSKVNMFNEDSIERFLNYTEKVFNNAMYAEKIAGVKSKLKNAKKNVNSKIGIAEGLQVLLENMFAINPTVIPDSVLDKYVGLVNMLGERSAVLNLKENAEVLSDTMDVLKAVEAELSLVDQLKEVFDNSKNIVVDEDGKLNYSDTIKEMLDADEINEYEASVMKKYKSSIVETEAKPKMTEEEKAVEKNELINSIRTADLFVNDMPYREERDLIKELSEYFNTDALESFDNATLKNIAKLTENISNGFLPHYANEILNTMKADNRSKTLFGATLKAKPLKLSKLYNDIKSKFTSKIDRSRTGVSELIRSAPLYYIDEQFGNFKSKEIFDSLFKDSAKAHDAFETEFNRIQSRIDKVQYDVLKSRGFDHNEAVKSNYKMMAYLLQLEKNANPDSDKVNNAGDYIDVTIDRINDGNTRYNENDVKALQEIKDEYGDPETGAIDINKLYKSFNKTEIEALKAIQEINKSLESKAMYTAAIIRGERIKPLNDYVHHNVLHESKAMDEQEGKSLIDNFNKNLQPSTKAKNLVERTKGVKPLNFDVFSATNRGAKFTLMDYHLTNPIRVSRKTLAKTKEELKKNKEWNGQNKEIFNAMESAYNETLENILMDSFTKSTFFDNLINEINKQGYRVMLAGTGKFGAELISNLTYVGFTNPMAFAKGIENTGTLLSEDAFKIMDNSKSLETSRFFSNDPLTGKFVDQNILNKSNKSLGSMHDSRAANVISKLYNKTGVKKYKNSVELAADTLVSAPDKLVSLPLWMGSYINEFEKVAGKKIDLEKIANNDEVYMTENKEAIEKATAKADSEAVQAAATRNPFMSILKGKVKPDQSFLLNTWNRANNFLNTYNMFEFFTARRAVMNAIGKGSMTKAEGAKLLAGVTTRMTVYGILMNQFGSGLIGAIGSMFGDDDDEEEKLKEEAKKRGVDLEESNWQKYGKYIASTMSSLLLGRNFGVATKTVLNTIVEKLNEEYGGFLRNGKEYDPRKDAVQFNTIYTNEYKDSGSLLKQVALKASGAGAPLTKAALNAYDDIMASPKKKKDAIDRAEKRMNVLIPLEVAGNLGFIPIYKDVRKEVMKHINKSLETAEIQSKIDKKNDLDILKKVKSDVYEPEMIQAIKRKEMELKGTDSKELEKYNAEKEVVKEKLLVDKSNNVTYKNKSEMEKYNPSLYEERFGDFSEWSRTYGADDKVDNMIDSYKEMLRDEEFGYYNSQSKHNKHKKDTRSQRSNDRESERGSERSGGR